MIVLDTNVLSEVLRPAPSPRVLRWFDEQVPQEVFVTAITQAEILYGVELLPAGKRRTQLHTAMESMLAKEFHGRILPFDEACAGPFAKIVSGRAAMGRPVSQFDGMIASICISRGAALATRNMGDFEHCGVRLINPWNG